MRLISAWLCCMHDLALLANDVAVRERLEHQAWGWPSPVLCTCCRGHSRPLHFQSVRPHRGALASWAHITNIPLSSKYLTPQAPEDPHGLPSARGV